MVNMDTNKMNLTPQQEADITALYNVSREQFPTTPAYFLWLIAVDYYMKDVVGKKQKSRMKNPLIDEKVKEMKANSSANKHTNILKLMNIEDNTNEIISNVDIE